MSKTKKKVIYGAAINLTGLYHDKPKRLFYDEECDAYFDKVGNFSVDGLGTIATDYLITFASEDKKKVELWMMGVKNTMSLLHKWSSPEY